MRTRRALMAIAALAIVAVGCGDDKGSSSTTTNLSTVVTSGSTSSSGSVTTSSTATSVSSGSTTSTTPNESSTPTEPMSLGDAIGETLDEKNATYTTLATDDGDVAGLVSRLMAMAGMADDTGPTSTTATTDSPSPFTGDLDFDSGDRMLTIDDPQGTLHVIVKGDSLYLQFEGDATWKELDLTNALEADTLAPLSTEDLIALHDPSAILKAAQDNADDATQSADQSASGLTQFDLDLRTDSIDDPFFTELASRFAADQVTLHMWVDGESNYVEAVDFSLNGSLAPPAPPTTTTEETTTTTVVTTTAPATTVPASTEAPTTEAPTTTIARTPAQLDVLTWYLTFGDAQSIDKPDGETAPMTADELASTLAVDVMMATGSESTPTTTIESPTTASPSTTEAVTTTAAVTTTSG